MKNEAENLSQKQQDLEKATNIVLRFDSTNYFFKFVNNIWHQHATESGIANATAFIEKSPFDILVGLTKYAKTLGLHDTKTNESKWTKSLLKQKETIAGNKDLTTINAFLQEFTPVYLKKIRENISPLERHYIDTTINNLFFYSLHFESRNAQKINDKDFRISETDTSKLTEIYHEFIQSMFPDISKNQYSEKHPETVLDLLAFLGRFESDNHTHPIANDPIFQQTKNNLTLLRQKETNGNLNLTNSSYLSADNPQITEKAVIEGLEHYLSYNHEKLPQETKIHLSSLLLSLLQQYAKTTIDKNYEQLKPEEKNIANPPWHASEFIDPNYRNDFLDKLDILRPSSISLPSPKDLIEQFISKSTEAMSALDINAKGYKRKLEKLEARLERFKTALQTVPESCELIVTPYTKRPSEESGKLRDDFNSEAKKQFIKSTALRHPIALLKHGLSIKEIFWMARNQSIPPSQKGILTIEHINDLAGGGFNESSGFCFMNSKLNNGKNDLIVPQTLDLEPGETALIVTYAPKKVKSFSGKNTYPIIVDDFKHEENLIPS